MRRWTPKGRICGAPPSAASAPASPVSGFHGLRIHHLAQETPDAIVYSDTEGLIAFWNKGAERIFGFSEAEALGRSLDIIIPDNMRSRHWEAYRNTMRTGSTQYGGGQVLAVPALRKDGTRISVEFTILPFLDQANRILGIAAMMRDATERFEEMKRLRNVAKSQISRGA